MGAPIQIMRDRAFEAKRAACRTILAECGDWGPVGRAMVLRGDYDEEPEMLRLYAAYELGVIAEREARP